MDLPKSFELNAADIKYDGQVLGKQVGNEVHVGSKELPIYVHMDSDTDWATVIPAGAGVVVAILVAWLTVGVQKNQIRGNLSNFRHHWMAELREAAAELISLMTYVVNMNSKQTGFKGSDEYYKACSRMSQLRARVNLLLSRDDDRSRKIIKFGGDANRIAIKVAYQSPTEKPLLKIKEYRDLLRAELEHAWVDTKNDLGFGSGLLFPKLSKKFQRQDTKGS
jgi:hypothetical protein